MRRLRHPVSLLLLMLGVILGSSGDQEDTEDRQGNIHEETEDRQGNVLFIRPPPPSYPQATSNHIHQYHYSDPAASYNQVRIYLSSSSP